MKYLPSLFNQVMDKLLLGATSSSFVVEAAGLMGLHYKNTLAELGVKRFRTIVHAVRNCRFVGALVYFVNN